MSKKNEAPSTLARKPIIPMIKGKAISRFPPEYRRPLTATLLEVA